MTPTELLNSLPEDLVEAFRASFVDRELGRDVGFPELRSVFGHVIAGASLNPETLRICEEKLPVWLEQQRALHDQARDVFIACYELEPPDIAGASIPAWYLTSWARTLRDPWSEHLATAVASGLAHLDDIRS